jgi:hypothetical protein
VLPRCAQVRAREGVPAPGPLWSLASAASGARAGTRDCAHRPTRSGRQRRASPRARPRRREGGGGATAEMERMEHGAVERHPVDPGQCRLGLVELALRDERIGECGDDCQKVRLSSHDSYVARASSPTATASTRSPRYTNVRRGRAFASAYQHRPAGWRLPAGRRIASASSGRLPRARCRRPSTADGGAHRAGVASRQNATSEAATSGGNVGAGILEGQQRKQPALRHRHLVRQAPGSLSRRSTSGYATSRTVQR